MDKNSTRTIQVFVSNFIRDEFFINVLKTCLYPAEFNTLTASGSHDTLSYIKRFLKDLNRICKNLALKNTQQISRNISLIETVLNIRESGSKIINYDNVFRHLSSLDLTHTKLIQEAIKDRIDNTDTFRTIIDEIIRSIQAFYEVQSISTSIMSLDEFVDYASKPTVNVFEAIKLYKDHVIQLYTNLSQLQTADKYGSEKDYFVIDTEESTKTLADTLFKYISSGYSFLRTGFDLFDDVIEGFESSSVHVITAPTNHGKSIFMVNLCHRIIQENLDEFEKGDAILFVTLEDDIYKLTRRFASVFGNYKAELVKDLYRRSYEAIKANKMFGTDTSLEHKITSMFQDLLNTSIHSVTGGKVSLIVKHASENTFSPGDLDKFIDVLRVEGYRVKLVFLDYINVASPTVHRYTSYKDYDVHGQIVHELRNIARNKKLPIVTATQNNKQSENITMAMNNMMIGDSYKKAQFSDFIYMCRMDRTKSVLTDEALQKTIPDMYFTHKSGSRTFVPEIMRLKDQIQEDLIPFEVKITKSKDSNKDKTEYLLFCGQNLRIYNNLGNYITDMPDLLKRNDTLNNNIQSLVNSMISNVSDTFTEEENCDTNTLCSYITELSENDAMAVELF